MLKVQGPQTQAELNDYLTWLMTLTNERLLDEKQEQEMIVRGNEEMIILTECGHNQYGASRYDYEHEALIAMQNIEIIEMALQG